MLRFKAVAFISFERQKVPIQSKIIDFKCLYLFWLLNSGKLTLYHYHFNLYTLISSSAERARQARRSHGFHTGPFFLNVGQQWNLNLNRHRTNHIIQYEIQLPVILNET